MRKYWLSLCLLAAATAWAAPPSSLFGGAVQLAGTRKDQVQLHADLDGDKSPDDIYLVRITGVLPAQVKAIDIQDDHAAPAKGKLAVAVVLHSGARYLLYGNTFFDTPTWNQGHFHDLVKVGHGPQPPKDARGRSIGLFTESGATYYWHWNGKTFVGSNEGDVD